MCTMHLLIGACSSTLAAVHVGIRNTPPPLIDEELGANTSHQLTVYCSRAYVHFYTSLLQLEYKLLSAYISFMLGSFQVNHRHGMDLLTW